MKQLEPSALFDQIQSSFSDLGLIDENRPLILMVSGGSDSVALLHFASELVRGSRASAHFLHVLHINHMLRGADSDKDECFVVGLCKQLGIACTVKRVDVAALAAKTGKGLEQTGREVRYREANTLLDEVSATLKCAPLQGRILVAHTADDRAETLLQRILVGGGSGSLASIPKQNGRIVRPLLGCTRQDLRHWLTARNGTINDCLWREDATNANTHYSRAFVRHELLPLLAERNPRIIEGLNRTSDVLAEESAWLDELALKLLPLSRDSFAAPLPLLRRAVYLACNQAIAELAPDARITFEHIERIVKGGSNAGFACQIPGGIDVRTTRKLILFTKAKPPQHDPRLK